MKNFINGFTICFSMYSAVPMPDVKWSKDNMKYVLLFFPLVGIVIGVVAYVWLYAAVRLSVSSSLFAAAALAIPVIISGGIHVDGFIDTCDAVFSRGNKEKKLQIMKDPHAGAFGIIYAIVYFAALFGLYSQLFESDADGIMLIPIFAISRGFCGLITVKWKSARASGLKNSFFEGASKNVVAEALIIQLIALFAFAAIINAYTAVFAGVALLIFYIWFHFYTEKQFGGITGDLAGFSVCIAELILLSAYFFGGVLT